MFLHLISFQLYQAKASFYTRMCFFHSVSTQIKQQPSTAYLELHYVPHWRSFNKKHANSLALPKGFTVTNLALLQVHRISFVWSLQFSRSQLAMYALEDPNIVREKLNNIYRSKNVLLTAAAMMAHSSRGMTVMRC